MDQLRRLYNVIDALFDRASLTENQQFTKTTYSGNIPVTAGQAFNECKKIVMDFDRKACLMLIVSPDGAIRSDGTSSRWEFFFDLPRRRAKMVIIWSLPWSDKSDDFAQAKIDVTVNPFPPPDSVQRQLVKEGKLLRKQLIGMWHKEHSRKPSLPHRFRDSDAVMMELARKGLDISQDEVTLKAENVTNKGPSWDAQSRSKSYQVSFV